MQRWLKATVFEVIVHDLRVLLRLAASWPVFNKRATMTVTRVAIGGFSLQFNL